MSENALIAPRGVVYFCQAGENGPIKIGWTSGSPRARMRALQTGNPARLRLLLACPAGEDAERTLHGHLEDLRLEGEWFRPEPILLYMIANIRNAPDPAAALVAWEIFGDEPALREHARRCVR